MKKGYVQVYTGEGKGKTTAAIGLAIRAAGSGLNVYIGQFLKCGNYSEVNFLSKCRDITIEQFGCKRHIKTVFSKKDRDAAIKGLERVRGFFNNNSFDVFIMDEINVVLHYGLLPVKDVVELVGNKPVNCEVILTGRDAPIEIIEIADLVSEIKEIKHYFKKGVLARAGIER